MAKLRHNSFGWRAKDLIKGEDARGGRQNERCSNIHTLAQTIHEFQFVDGFHGNIYQMSNTTEIIYNSVKQDKRTESPLYNEEKKKPSKGQ